MSSYEVARAHMIASQLRPNGIIDRRLLDALATIRRELFVPEGLRAVAYVDEGLPLGAGRYLMEPRVAARLLQAASVGPADIALVVGAGSGYEAAVLGLLARSVVALEEDANLARMARAALVEHGIASVAVVEGPLRQGCRARAPFEVILFGGAVAEVPPEIGLQLADGGRLVAVVRAAGSVGRGAIYTRSEGVFAHRPIFDAATPLLPGFSPRPAFTL
ncbi:MAG TPA: protein-L-isoaspartate O-methyltransferase [Stellaceae bacterium]|nr:protein-L-isoaspartate O-methyltransferase [Stellaceae bacterium]